MKSSTGSIVAFLKFAAKSPLFPAMALALAVTGCHNYTTAPLCTADNSVDPMQIPGFSGVYEYTTQDENFANTTEVVDLSSKQAAAAVLTDGATCLVGGNYYVQAQDEYELGYWSYQRLVISGTGVSLFDMIFDRPGLDAAGLATWTFEIPQTLKRILGDHLSNQIAGVIGNVLAQQEAVLGMAIDNAGVSAESVLAHADPLPVGLTLTRR